MITSIKMNQNDNEYRDLFNMATESLKTFIENHVKSASVDGTEILIVDDGVISFNKELFKKGDIIDTVDFTEGTYPYEDMGKSVKVDLTETIVKDICQAYVDIGGDEVAGLEEYFGIIKTLTDYLDTNYQILPIDEETFEIDANKREIKIPKNNYVYAVKGDNLAETIFFTIDRYFDNVDLATKDIAVLSSINGKKYWTAITLKDITSTYGKIKFGWPIGNIITNENSGTLEFSVRFIDWNEGAQNSITGIDYSFSTLPARLIIKDTLNFLKDADDVIVDNSSQKLKELLNNNDIHGTAAILAPEFYYPVNLEYNLGGDNYTEAINLSAAAFSLDDLDISYTWTKDSGEGYQIIENEIDMEEEYIQLNDKPTISDVKAFSQFYYKENDSQEEFTPINLVLDNDGKNIIGIPENANLWYRRGAILEASEAGLYQCIAKISRGLRTKTAKSKVITIPYPSKFTIEKSNTFNKDLRFHFQENEDYENEQVILSLDTILVNDYENKNNEGIIKSSLKKEPNTDNTYYLERTNSKNNAETDIVKFEGIEIYPPLKDEYLDISVTESGENRTISWKKKDNIPDYISFDLSIIAPGGKSQTYDKDGSFESAYKGATFDIEIIYKSNLPYLTDLTAPQIQKVVKKKLGNEGTTLETIGE